MDDITLAVRAARHVADVTAQMDIGALWRAKGDPDEARWMLNRLAAELHSTRAALEATLDPSWWDAASVDDIAHTYQLARIWSRDHSDIGVLERRMLMLLKARYGASLSA